MVELHAPGLEHPTLVIAEPAGEPTAGMFPLRLRPLDEYQKSRLDRLDSQFETHRSSTRLDSLDDPIADAMNLGVIPPLDTPLIEPKEAVSKASPVRKKGDGLVGRVLGAGKYEILRRIGIGGIGEVFLGRHRSLEKPIAIKVLRGASDASISLFRREALAAGRLAHPNVVQILDFDREADGTHFIVMELIDGTDVRSMIAKQGPLPLSLIVDLGCQLCEGLGAAHAQGIVHRDVKPENLIAMRHPTEPGYVLKICDFGAARAVGLESVGATQTGVLRGTPEFMAPEQILNEAVDPRTDVYACGVVLYEMATKRLPFFAERIVEVLNMHLNRKPPPPSRVHPGVAPDLEAAILRALSKDKTRRQQSAQELHDELTNIGF